MNGLILKPEVDLDDRKEDRHIDEHSTYKLSVRQIDRQAEI